MKAALIILDGWGLKEGGPGNAIERADPKYFNGLLETCPNTAISASGEDVGLPDGQMGNSEVGHLNIGAGRVILQSLDQIRKDLETGALQENELFCQAFANPKQRGKKLHLLGLVSDGGVHSHLDHVKGLLKYAAEQGLTQVYVHAFTDGRDTLPDSGKGFLEDLQSYMHQLGVGKIATVSGRYYAMDRDKRWERTEKAYRLLVDGKAEKQESDISALMQASYDAGITDEFVIPTLVDPDGMIEAEDTVFFFNFRPDRARQLTMALTQEPFSFFPVQRLNLDYYCMTEYDAQYRGLHVIYPHQTVPNTMGEYLSSLGKRQFRIAETEKYPHVTFFFNGGREECFAGEERCLVSSPKVATYDLQPHMSCYMVKDRLVEAIDEERADFYLVNFANPDMVGHTGVLEAGVKAIKAVDQCLKEVTDALKEKGVGFIITADHGNAEEMIDPVTGEVLTQHTTNLVPMIVGGVGDVQLSAGGRLSDLSPTLLDMMGLEKPLEMTGRSLIRR